MLLIVLLLALAGCAGREAPVVTIQAAPLPEGWQRVELPGLDIALPADWSVLDGDDTDPAAAVAELEAQNPELEQLLQRSAAEFATGSVELVAVDAGPVDSSGYPANMRVGRQVYDATVTLDAVGDANERELQAMPAFSDITREPVMIGEQAAERLRSRLALNDALGNPLTLALEQYLMVTGSEVVVITFAAAEESAARYRPIWDGVLATLRLN